MKNLLAQITGFAGSEAWISEILIVITIAIIARFIASFILKYAKKVSNLTKNNLDDAVVKAAESPLSVLIWLIALNFCGEILVTKFHSEDVYLILPIVKVSIAICFAWFLIRLVNFITQSAISSEKFINDEFNRTTIDAVSKILKLLIIVVTILTILQISGVSISGILAAGGAGGLVIGFAAKDLFANVFGGLTIYLDRPFNVGDWIRCAEKNIEGSVEHIGWRQTRLRAFNKNPIYVPNAIFTNAVVENPSRMTHRRIKEHIGIRYQDISKMEIITKEVKELLSNHDNIDKSEGIIVKFDIFNASSIDFLIYAFTKSTGLEEYLEFKQDIYLKIAAIIESHGADIAFPTRTLHVENQSLDSVTEKDSK